MVQSKISKITGKTATDISDFLDQVLMGREAEVHNVLINEHLEHTSIQWQCGLFVKAKKYFYNPNSPSPKSM